MRLIDKAYRYFWDNIVASADRRRMEKQTLPGGVSAILDVPYIEDGKRAHLFDVYFPDGKETEKLPCVIDIHGGGLMYAYKELNKNYCYHLAKRGFAVINVSYSLCPEDRFPTCLTDVLNALKYIGENIDAYPCDREKVFITGDSAGGLLAAYASLAVKSAELRKVYGVGDINLDIKAAGFTSGMFFFDGIVSLISPGIFGKGGKRKSAYKNYLEFCDIIDKGVFPPSYLVTSKEDMVRGASIKFKQLLDDRGIENCLDDYPKGNGHKLEHVFSVLYPSEYPESRRTIDKMTEFFLSHC